MKPKNEKIRSSDKVVLGIVAIMIFGMFITGASTVISLSSQLAVKSERAHSHELD